MDLPALNGTIGDVHTRTSNFLKYVAEQHRCSGKIDEVVLLASHQTTVHSLLHQCNSIPMEELNFEQGDVAELQWKNVVQLVP